MENLESSGPGDEERGEPESLIVEKPSDFKFSRFHYANSRYLTTTPHPVVS